MLDPLKSRQVIGPGDSIDSNRDFVANRRAKLARKPQSRILDRLIASCIYRRHLFYTATECSTITISCPENTRLSGGVEAEVDSLFYASLKKARKPELGKSRSRGPLRDHLFFQHAADEDLVQYFPRNEDRRV